MKRAIYPDSFPDRLLFWIAVANILLSAANAALGSYFTALGGVAVAGICGSLSYFSRSLSSVKPGVDEYSDVISRISIISGHLQELDKFLKGEEERVKASKATVRQLEEEKTLLEPLVNTQRAALEAVLGAHAARMSRSVWKERFIGFALGTLASMLASIIYGRFQ